MYNKMRFFKNRGGQRDQLKLNTIFLNKTKLCNKKHRKYKVERQFMAERIGTG